MNATHQHVTHFRARADLRTDNGREEKVALRRKQKGTKGGLDLPLVNALALIRRANWLDSAVAMKLTWSIA